MTTALLVACAAGLVVTLVGEGLEVFALRAVGKTVASLAFLGYGVALGLPAAGPYGVAATVALALSVVGDVALLGSSKRAFLGGLGAFLLAHVAFAVAFGLLGPSWGQAAAAGTGLALVAVLVWRWLKPHVGQLAGPVVAYIACITVMVALASGVAAGGGSRLWIGVGAVLFFSSDLFVARQRFVAPGHVNRYVGLPLYYAAQLLLAWALAAA